MEVEHVKEQLQERLELLTTQLQDAQKRMEQAISDANAIGGAIQEIRYWISRAESGIVNDQIP